MPAKFGDEGEAACAGTDTAQAESGECTGWRAPRAGKPPLTEAHFAAQRAIYSLHSGLADITEGTDGPVTSTSGDGGVGCGPQCQTGPGYDLTTGLGSPRPGIDTALAAAR